MIQLFYADMHQLQQNNYSYERFSFDGVDRSLLFDLPRHTANLDWFFSQSDNIYQLYTRLADQRSRDLYVNLLRFKLAGHLHVRIEADAAHRGAEKSAFQVAFPGTPSALATSGMFGAILHYDGEWEGVHYTADTGRDAFMETLVYRQYFLERGELKIAPVAGDYVLDCGACFGETAIVFSRAVGPAGRVFSFDLVSAHLDICALNFSRPGFENIRLVPRGVSDRSFDAPPVPLDTYSPGFRVDERPLPLVRIDELVMSGEIPRVDFIKMDVEGSEVAALRGALSTIHKFRPKLAISVYHRPNDFFEVGNLLLEQNLGYKLFLDHYTTWHEETVLYATC